MKILRGYTRKHFELNNLHCLSAKVFKRQLPQNMFRINNGADAKTAFKWIEDNMVNDNGMDMFSSD